MYFRQTNPEYGAQYPDGDDDDGFCWFWFWSWLHLVPFDIDDDAPSPPADETATDDDDDDTDIRDERKDGADDDPKEDDAGGGTGKEDLLMSVFCAFSAFVPQVEKEEANVDDDHISRWEESRWSQKKMLRSA